MLAYGSKLTRVHDGRAEMCPQEVGTGSWEFPSQAQVSSRENKLEALQGF